MALLSSLLALTILGAIFFIGLRVKVVNFGYRINQEIQNKERIIEENKRLSLEIASLKSPTRIETEAKEKLGLALPQPHQIIYLKGASAEAMDLALGKIKPIPLAPAKSAPAAAVPKIALPSEPKKTEAPARTKPISEKHSASSKILIAKIVGNKSLDGAAKSKLSPVKKSPPLRESVPAVMLDSMP